MEPSRCSRCKRDLTPSEEKRVPRLIVIAASVAFAFMHGGMWVYEELSGPYCLRCRKTAAAIAAGAAVVILGCAAGLAALWIRGPKG